MEEGKTGGAEGNRTPGLIIANDALYQLSYGPTLAGYLDRAERKVKRGRRAFPRDGRQGRGIGSARPRAGHSAAWA